MTLLINILIIVSSYLPQGSISNSRDKTINPHYSRVSLMLSLPEENKQENFLPTFDHKKEIIKEFFWPTKAFNTNNPNISTSLLNRLLPSLIDVPPPLFEFYIS